MAIVLSMVQLCKIIDANDTKGQLFIGAIQMAPMTLSLTHKDVVANKTCWAPMTIAPLAITLLEPRTIGANGAISIGAIANGSNGAIDNSAIGAQQVLFAPTSLCVKLKVNDNIIKDKSKRQQNVLYSHTVKLKIY